jgi:Na+/phosphate symporter
VPQEWLVGVQLYRAEGGIFLVLYATGWLPALFAWPAGLGDILVGVLTPVIAIAYARAPRQNADLVWAWNVFGLADLLVAVTTGFLTSLNTPVIRL